MTKWEYLMITRHRSWEGTHGDHYQATEWEDTILRPNGLGGSDKQETHVTADVLNQLGEEGWELVDITNRSSFLGGERIGERTRDFAGFTSNELWVFKRPKLE